MNNLRQEKCIRDHGTYRRLILLVYPLTGGIAARVRSRPLARLEPDVPESRPSFAYASRCSSSRDPYSLAGGRSIWRTSEASWRYLAIFG